MEITTLGIGIDIADPVFQLHGVEAAAQALKRKRLRQNQVLDFMPRLPRCLSGIEAYGTSHHLAREIAVLGHGVRRVPTA